jgi:hypothetical protein
METAFLLALAVLLIIYASYQLVPQLYRRMLSIGTSRISSIQDVVAPAEAPSLPTAAPISTPLPAAAVRRDVRVLTLVSAAAAILYYLPFWLHTPSFGGIPFRQQGMDRVYGMWDGPLWVTAAATLWDPNPHNPSYAWMELRPSDYAERFPAFPLAIRLLSPVFGYWKGALIINLAASTAVTLLLYAFLRRFGTAQSEERPGSRWSPAFWVALVLIFWPPRGFLYRYVPMSEPLFILSVLAAAYFFKTRRYTLCGICGAVGVATRPNGCLLIIGFGLLALWLLVSLVRQRRVQEVWRLAGLTLMPLTLFAILLWHQHLFGDWLAAYHAADFVHPQARLYPFLYFFHIGEEGTPYVFFLVLVGICELVRRRHWDLAIVSAAFYLPTLTVGMDVDRYLLPVLPFTFGLAGERILASTPVRIALLLSLPLVYTYAWSTMLDPGYQAPFAPLRALLP